MKLMAANRSEIAIRIFRAATEMNMRTVAIYAQEDRLAVHRFKADEAYEIGVGMEPIAAYLSVEEIIRVAQLSGADAIHPGYGFLSEQSQFAVRCQEEGITFIGPRPEHLKLFGNKSEARLAAHSAKVPTLRGTDRPVGLEEAIDFFDELSGGMVIKAVSGGGSTGGAAVARTDA